MLVFRNFSDLVQVPESRIFFGSLEAGNFVCRAFLANRRRTKVNKHLYIKIYLIVLVLENLVCVLEGHKIVAQILALDYDMALETKIRIQDQQLAPFVDVKNVIKNFFFANIELHGNILLLLQEHIHQQGP